jgi:RNA polymerase sigma-70 factor (ECF subfamily)
MGPAMRADQTTQIQRCLDRLRAGDESARDELVRGACTRFERLTRQMLVHYPGVQRWEQAEDVLQNSLVRLWKALQQVVPSDVRGFCRLAALQIRREMIDLARHYQSLHEIGPSKNQADTGQALAAAPGSPDSSLEPARLAVWSEFHRAVDSLPDDEKEVFDLLWYQELTQPEAAALLQVDVRTVKRRWQGARLKLAAVFPGGAPGP